MSLCSVFSCTNQGRNSQNLCRPHAQEQRATGDLTKTSLTPRMVGDTGETTRVYSKICSIENCDKETFSRGWCGMHYARWSRNGDPLIGRPRAAFASIIAPFRLGQYDQFSIALKTFIIKVRRPGIDSDCWEWTGPKQGEYAKVTKRLDGKNVAFYVHRMSLEAKLDRPLHPKMQAHHKCSNGICVNPDHLEESTHNENTGEMKARTYYLARIEELELALAEFDPTHALLS